VSKNDLSMSEFKGYVRATLDEIKKDISEIKSQNKAFSVSCADCKKEVDSRLGLLEQSKAYIWGIAAGVGIVMGFVGTFLSQAWSKLLGR
jgi:hypothetical protein